MMSYKLTIKHCMTSTDLQTGTKLSVPLDSNKGILNNKFSVADLYEADEEAVRSCEALSIDEETLAPLGHAPASVGCVASTSVTPIAHNPQSNTTSQGDHTSSSCLYEFPECEEADSTLGLTGKPASAHLSTPTLEEDSKAMWNCERSHLMAYSENTCSTAVDVHPWRTKQQTYILIPSYCENGHLPSSFPLTMSEDIRNSSHHHDSATPPSTTPSAMKRRRSRLRKNSPSAVKQRKRSSMCGAELSSSVLPPDSVKPPPASTTTDSSTSGRLLLRLSRSTDDSNCYRVEMPVSSDCIKTASLQSVDSAPLSAATSASCDVAQGEGELCTSQDQPLTSCHLSDGRKFHVGDIVWAKISGYPFWPSKIVRIAETEVPIASVSSRSRRGGAARGNGGDNKIQQYPCTTSTSSREGYVREYRCCVDWLAWNQCSYITCDKLFHFEEHFEKKYSPKNTKRNYAQAVREAQQIVASRKAEVLKSVPPPVSNSLSLEMLPSPVGVSTGSSIVSHVPPIATSGQNQLSLSSTESQMCLPNIDLSSIHSMDTKMANTSFLHDSNTDFTGALNQFWNPMDLPELSGQLFDETPSGTGNVLEFSDDEEINYRKAITNLALNL